MESILELFSYTFFQKALFVGILLSIVFSFLGIFIVMRQEVLMTHAISHMALFGIVIALFFDIPYPPLAWLMSIVGILCFIFLKKHTLNPSDSNFEIIAQFGLTSALILLSQIEGFRVDINQFLFGDILSITTSDIWITSIICIITFCIIVWKYQDFLQISLSSQLAGQSKKSLFTHIILMILIAMCITLALKIIGVLLVSAFLTLPANSAKLFCPSLFWTTVFSAIIALVGTFFGLILSGIFDIPSGPSITLVLLLVWFISIFFRRP